MDHDLHCQAVEWEGTLAESKKLAYTVMSCVTVTTIFLTWRFIVDNDDPAVFYTAVIAPIVTYILCAVYVVSVLVRHALWVQKAIRHRLR